MPVTQKILINVSPQEVRVAVVENDVLQELQIERNHDLSIVGNIYKGKVTRVLPDMQAVFVDIGLPVNGFLHVADLAKGSVEASMQEPRIQDLLHQGNFVWVQVVKDSIGNKGPRLKTQLSIASRHLIHRPHAADIGVSQKIANIEKRAQLQSVLQELQSQQSLEGGLIIRTVAETASAQALLDDVVYLKQTWTVLSAAMQDAKLGSIVYRNRPLALRVLMDLQPEDVQQISIDSQPAFVEAVDFATKFVSQLTNKIAFYDETASLFDINAIEQQIETALQQKVPLASGANLLIEPTESMTTIDINTASNIGRQKLSNTEQANLVFKTNLEAIDEIARQLRLRNLGGIIIVDFIDMNSAKHKQAVLDAMEIALSKDSVRSKVGKMSALGLVEITRKRTRRSLDQILCEDCDVCSGSGRIKTAQSVCYEILRQIKREARQYKASAYTVLAAVAVIELLRNDEASSLRTLQAWLERPINLQLEAHYHQQQYDIVLS